MNFRITTNPQKYLNPCSQYSSKSLICTLKTSLQSVKLTVDTATNWVIVVRLFLRSATFKPHDPTETSLGNRLIVSLDVIVTNEHDVLLSLRMSFGCYKQPTTPSLAVVRPSVRLSPTHSAPQLVYPFVKCGSTAAIVGSLNLSQQTGQDRRRTAAAGQHCSSIESALTTENVQHRPNQIEPTKTGTISSLLLVLWMLQLLLLILELVQSLCFDSVAVSDLSLGHMIIYDYHPTKPRSNIWRFRHHTVKVAWMQKQNKVDLQQGFFYRGCFALQE